MILPTIVTAEDLFQELNPENEIPQKKLKVKKVKNENLERLVESYEKFYEITSSLDIGAAKIDEKGEDDPFCTLANIIIPKQYTSRDITEFCLRYSKDFQTIDGYYLSALFNKSPENKFEIFLANPISYIGWENRGKDITVIGDVNEFLGAGMRKGRIVVKGSVGDYTGECMRNGVIIIEGNAGNDLGRLLYGGKIEVYGNVGNDLGESMKSGLITINGNSGYNVGTAGISNSFVENGSGTIRLKGDYKSLGSVFACNKIYHRGKLIVSKGVRI